MNYRSDTMSNKNNKKEVKEQELKTKKEEELGE